MIFNSFIPTKLTGIVDLIWEQEVPVPGRYTVLPSGKVELIFPIQPIEHLEAVKITDQDNPVNNHSCFLSGLHTRPLRMIFDRFHAFGIQMKPIAVKALFGMPLCHIRDYFVEGHIILETIRRMEEQLHSPKTFTEKAQWFENFLLKKIDETADLHIAFNIDQTIRKFIAQKQQGTSKSIEDLMGYSRTQTFRLFNDWFGLSAHSYQKLRQFIHTVESLHSPEIKLIEVGYENGYFDQSHFIRTFQEYADMTPGEYRKQMSPFPGQLFG